MGAKKIVDEDEVIEWFHAGETYDWMIAKYLELYSTKTTRGMWSTFRSRKRLPRRNVRNTDLIPWKVKEEHRYEYPVMMLRAEGRRLDPNAELTPEDEARLKSWKAKLKEENVVVHYDPDHPDGWFYVKRQPGDTELIHPPEKATGNKPRD